jgi:hypothetical protein
VRRASLAVVLLVALSLAAATGLADSTRPELDVYTINQSRGAATELALDVSLLAASPAAARIMLTAPAGYGATLTEAIGAQLGNAEIDLATPGATGAPFRSMGSIVVSDPAAFAASAPAQQCAPGTHTATWSMNLADGAAIPIAVDAVTSGGPYHITECLNTYAHPGQKAVDVYIDLTNVFSNPSDVGTYWWNALVTPADATGAANPAAAFEMEGGEPIPEPLTVSATWDARKHMFTAHGILRGGGAPRSAIRVHLLAGSTSNRDTMREIGVATTTNTGSYVFRQHRTAKPAFVYAEVRYYIYGNCVPPQTAPAGCASRTIDGTDSVTVKTH